MFYIKMLNKRYILNLLFIITSFLIYLYLLITIKILNLLNPPDEFEFKKLIFNTNINNFDFGSPIFAYIYSILKYPESEFYLKVKYLNIFFFLIGNFFIYLIAKYLGKELYAKFIFILSSIYIYHFYASAVMPESFFYFYFYFSIYLFIILKNQKLKYSFFALNLFILFLIKGTGLFVFFAVCFSELLLIIKKRNFKQFKNFFLLIVVFLILFFIFYFIKPDNNSSFIFGEKYDFFNLKILLSNNIQTTLSIFAQNIIGHIFYVILIFGLPLILILKISINKNDFENILIYPIIIVIFLILFSSANHTLWVLIADEPINRITPRYYDFLLPLFLIVMIYIEKFNFKKNNKLTNIITICLVLTIVIYLFTQLNFLKPTYVIFDGMLLRGILYNSFALNVFLIFSALILILSFFQNFNVTKIFIFFFIPFITLVSYLPLYKEISSYKNANDYDKLGIYLKKYLKNHQVNVYYDNLIGEDYRVLFHLNNLKIKKNLKLKKSKNNEQKNPILIINNDKKMKIDIGRKFLNKYILIF